LINKTVDCGQQRAAPVRERHTIELALQSRAARDLVELGKQSIQL
jgi:hypothetical protein